MFFPVKNTLGYSDAFLLDALIYIPARLFGADPFLSFQWTAMGLSLIGFASFNILLTRYTAVRQPLAAVAAGVFAFSNALFISAGHSQLLEVNFCPLITVLILQAGRDSAKAGTRAIATGFAGGAILGLLFSTGYYVAWYYFLSWALTLVVYCFLQNGLALRDHARAIARKLRAVIAICVGLGVGLVPFCLIYGPVIAALPGRSFSEYLFYAPNAIDLLNVGAHNQVWGRVLGLLHIIPKDHLDNGEMVLAITPILLITYIGCVVAVLSGRVLAGAQDRRLRNALLASFVAFAMIAAAMMKFHEHSLFRVAWDLIPGARAIRAGGRAQIVLNGIAAAGSVIVLTRVLEQTQARHVKVLFSLLPVLVLIEQFNDADSSRLSRAAEMAFVAAPRAPAECKSFFISPQSSPGGERASDSVEQIDAMLIAEEIGVPTLNGYSGLSPPGWRLGNIGGRNYQGSVATWVKRHEMQAGLCRYDGAARHWQLAELQPYAIGLGSSIAFKKGGDGETIEGEGWSDPEPSGTWTSANKADLFMTLSDWHEGPVAVEVAARPFLVEGRHPHLDVEVLANGHPVGTWTYDVARDAGAVRRLAIIPESILSQSSPLHLTFRISGPMAPSEVGISSDSRRLGIFVSRISVLRVEENSVIRDTPRITPGNFVSFGDQGDGEPFEVSGWSSGEPSGTWTVGPRATFSADISGWSHQDMLIVLTARPYLLKDRHPRLDVDVVVNEVAVGRWAFREEEDRGMVTRSIRVPANVLAKSPVLKLEFSIQAPSSPAKLELNSADARELGLMVARIVFDRTEN